MDISTPEQANREKIEIFFSYAHEDEKLCEQLEAHLSFLRWQGLTIDWHRRNISAGTEWEQEIDTHLNTADIILLLISSDFMHSTYCYSKEMKRAMERHEAKKARVIPILLRPVYWWTAPFSKLQALPPNGRPVVSTSWHSSDQAFEAIAQGICDVVEELTQKPLGVLLRKQSVGRDNKMATTSSGRGASQGGFIADTSLLGSREAYTVSPSQIFTPSLVIFLGSAAAITGLELMRQMLTLSPTDRDRIRFVFIDTDDPPLALASFRQQYRIFQEKSVRIAVPTGIANAERTEHDQHTFIENKIPQYFTNGTGGIRNNGHVAFCFNYAHIYGSVGHTIDELKRVAVKQDVIWKEMHISIVAFLGGGTGSGILPDIAATIRELLSKYGCKSHIDVFCTLPEALKNVHPMDLRWRKSNTTACLLELLALGCATTANGYYNKYIRGRCQRLLHAPIVDEIHLFGQTAIDDAEAIACMVAVDLFQRITDASGVGFLEHSQWMDRRPTEDVDDRGLPNIFGISCSLEVLFPLRETAQAFAQISASYLLPPLAQHVFAPLDTSDTEKREWLNTWDHVAQLDIGSSTILNQLPEVHVDDIQNADQARLDQLWRDLKKHERLVKKWMEHAVKVKRNEEMKRIIDTSPRQGSSLRLFYQQIQHLERLYREYTIALDNLKEEEPLDTFERPIYLEKKLIDSFLLSPMTRDKVAEEICNLYNERRQQQGKVIRLQLLKRLLFDLKRLIQDNLSRALYMFEVAEGEAHAKELRKMGETSSAWQGRVDNLHSHQRHIFDLPSLRVRYDGCTAVERLYKWATWGNRATDDEPQAANYNSFIGACISYLSHRNTTRGKNGLQNTTDAQEQNEVSFADRIVLFFRDYYMERLESVNLFELLDIGAPPNENGQPRREQLSVYLQEHLQRIHPLESSLLVTDVSLWEEGISRLKTSLYLGMHWRNEEQREVLDQALNALNSIKDGTQGLMLHPALDLHRLQLSYGRHCISLGTVKDFCDDLNSAMEAYLIHQQAWTHTNGRGSMPVHTCGEMQRLVHYPSAPDRGVPLWEHIIRLPTPILKEREARYSSPFLQEEATPDPHSIFDEL